MNESEEKRVRDYLHRFIWLTAPAEDKVVDFVRQARMGEGPRLLAVGRLCTGKTRLARVLSVLLPEMVVIDAGTDGLVAAMLKGSFSTFPILATTGSLGVAALVEREVCPVVKLPVVDSSALRQAGVDLYADERDFLDAVRGVWA